MLSGIGIAVLVLSSAAFVAMTGAIIVNVLIVTVSAFRRHRQRTGGIASGPSADTGRTSP